MRCRDVDALWDELRGECQASLKETVHTHSALARPAKRHVRAVRRRRILPLVLPRARALVRSRKESRAAHRGAQSQTLPANRRLGRSDAHRPALRRPKEHRIAYIGIDTGEARWRTCSLAWSSACPALRRRGVPGVAARDPRKLLRYLDRRRGLVDISDLTPFEQAALRAAASIPPGEVRSYAWVATQIGRPRAARAVGRVMARNPLPMFFPCHRVVDSIGRTAQLLLRSRDEGSNSEDGGQPGLGANLNERADFGP